MPRVRSQRQVTLREAKKYLKKVKGTVSDGEYQIFMTLIQEIKDKRSDIDPTIRKVIELFKHNGGLLSGFNCFLPEAYKIVPLMRPGRYEIRGEAFRRLPTQNQDGYE
ncbi:hypothetical protein Vadar_006753 [Vaccinium darrowii]|uniref:Uncharacterized protein n=1 Tax=Vaccinium darrowii TaxID=229202 RepID=A0ACB7YK99_9ERIC|nr:hypothetical protein Vadar_006753 [Vaccinium darrowii]